MGIYSSGMSCWQRRIAGLNQDHAGPDTIQTEKKSELKSEKKAELKSEKVEKVMEDVAVEVKVKKPRGKAKTSKNAQKKSIMDKIRSKK